MSAIWAGLDPMQQMALILIVAGPVGFGVGALLCTPWRRP